MKMKQNNPTKITCLKDLRKYKDLVDKRAQLAKELFKNESIQMVENIASASTTKLIAATPALIQGVIQSQQNEKLESNETGLEASQMNVSTPTPESRFQTAMKQKGSQFVTALLEELAVRYVR